MEPHGINKKTKAECPQEMTEERLISRRRLLIKAGWMVPVVAMAAIPTSVMAQASCCTHDTLDTVSDLDWGSINSLSIAGQDRSREDLINFMQGTGDYSVASGSDTRILMIRQLIATSLFRELHPEQAATEWYHENSLTNIDTVIGQANNWLISGGVPNNAWLTNYNAMTGNAWDVNGFNGQPIYNQLWNYSAMSSFGF